MASPDRLPAIAFVTWRDGLPGVTSSVLCVAAAGRMPLRLTVGPGSGVPCLLVLTGTAHEPAPDDPRHQAADDHGRDS
jgi:hypothetical protein